MLLRTCHLTIRGNVNRYGLRCVYIWGLRRVVRQQLKSIEEELEELRAASAPKAKFSFKRKAAKASAPSTIGTAPTLAPSTTSLKPTSAIAPEGLSISSKSNAYVTTVDLGDVQTTELAISDLDHCVVNLIGSDERSFSTIHVRNVSNSILLLGNVNGSVLLHDLRCCVLVLKCHQFRMHTSSNIDVYLAIPSNPIIEHCSGIRFSSYPPSLRPAESPEAAESKHLSVQDFSHIKPTPSPNWSELPSDQVIREWPVQALSPTSLEQLLPLGQS
ncbi:TBCC-domain-containing protein [Heliocybe sulcata]|uniref:TBCC-domain-containing protein n=1 Tax=Heliocybe sulcata TaxID=5364 RepID=A0A5C3N8J2_9AGAM|nr:TBCC-domain-containing protein [Heliocybe sulcata]